LPPPTGSWLEEHATRGDVKHRRNEQMGADKVRALVVVFEMGDKGLFVSTGGFAKEAKYEAERSNIPIESVDCDMLVNLITPSYYDNFDSDTKSRLPLRKILMAKLEHYIKESIP